MTLTRILLILGILGCTQCLCGTNEANSTTENNERKERHETEKRDRESNQRVRSREREQHAGLPLGGVLDGLPKGVRQGDPRARSVVQCASGAREQELPRSRVVASALLQLCGHRAQRFAPLVREMAQRHGIPWRMLVANVASESRCNPRADSGKGDYGLGQIRVGGSAAGKHTRLQLLQPRLNLRLTARHMRRCFDLCGWWAGALSVYKGHRKCRSSKGARRVMGLARSIGFDERNS
jgi:hypothetical protein